MEYVKKETLAHQEAFFKYYAQGANRSLAKLAKELEVSETAVKTWSASFKWRERVVEMDMLMAKEAKASAIREGAEFRKGVVQTVTQFHGIIRAKLNKMLQEYDAWRKLNADEQKKASLPEFLTMDTLQAMRVFNEAAKLSLLMQGDPTEINLNINSWWAWYRLQVEDKSGSIHHTDIGNETDEIEAVFKQGK